MGKTNEKALGRPFGRSDGVAARLCDHPGCAEEGQYRAPRSRERLRDYYWFCLEHVRAYNLAWNFFRDMSEAEVERLRRQDTVWERPSWPLGGARGGRGANFERFADPFDLMGEGNGPEKAHPQRPMSEEDKALALFNLERPVNVDEIKRRYKELAKRLHPDANGGDKAAEEHLKVINQAYAVLKACHAV